MTEITFKKPNRRFISNFVQAQLFGLFENVVLDG